MHKFMFEGALALTALVISLLVALIAPVSAQEVVIARDAAPDAAAVVFTQIADGFARPLLVTHAGDGSNRLFVVEQGGNIYVIENGKRLETPFLDVSDSISPEAYGAGYSERGLLGLAFHPQYAENGRFFINYTDLAGTTILARYTVSADDANTADPASVEVLIAQEQPFPNHNGGHLAFGADGYLYIGLGDGGAAGVPLLAGQDLGTWLGKILRLDVNGDAGFAVPQDNPFVGQVDALPEIWAYGLRNPWRFTFDRITGDLFIGDVGQNSWEEVNFQPASSPGGENYGWNLYEGLHPYNGERAPVNMTLPIAEYNHSEGNSVTAGYVYRGEAIPELQGAYFYGDFGTGTIWSAWRDTGLNWRSSVFLDSSGFTISSFGEDEAGEMYVVDYNGSLHRFDSAQ